MRHFEETVDIRASAEEIFSFADNHRNLASHMNQSSWMMPGGQMTVKTDAGNGQQIGSHIMMSGKVLGANLFLDEVITKYEPPFKKEWKTVGKINLLIIDHYKLGFEIKPKNGKSSLRVYIDYDLPKSIITYWLGLIFSNFYARWCVNEMIRSVENNF